jgi:hypothetical protein
MKYGKAKKKSYGYCVFQLDLTYEIPISIKISEKQLLDFLFLSFYRLSPLFIAGQPSIFEKK